MSNNVAMLMKKEDGVVGLQSPVRSIEHNVGSPPFDLLPLTKAGNW